jgi:DNA-binding transcriptional LysR family regulator
MWQPDLINAIAEGTVDVAITCGLLSEPPGVIGEVFCAETFMVALRTTHRFATRDSVSFADLAHDRLGFPNESLFPHGHRRNGRPSPTPPSHHRPSN